MKFIRWILESGALRPFGGDTDGVPTRLGNIAPPIDGTDVATKDYVDTLPSSVTLAEVLTNGKETGGSDIALTNSNKITSDEAVNLADAGTCTQTSVGDGRNWVTTISLDGFVVGEMPANAEDLCFGALLCTIHTGYITSFNTYLEFSGAGTDHTIEVALGTAEGSGAFDQFSSAATGASDVTNGTIGDGDLVGSQVGKASGSGVVSRDDIFVNVAGAWLADNDGNLTCSGTIVIAWSDISI